GALYGFMGERVPIKRTIKLDTVFREWSGVRTIPVFYTVVDAEASYNIIMGRAALNQLGAVVSMYHLCMKFSVSHEVGSVWADSRVAQRFYEGSLRVGGSPPRSIVNVLDLDLRCLYENERSHPVEDVKKVQIGPLETHLTKIGAPLGP
ncbi:hypothetical protein CR513_15477, partial [Mucuna pruriens]